MARWLEMPIHLDCVSRRAGEREKEGRACLFASPADGTVHMAVAPQGIRGVCAMLVSLRALGLVLVIDNTCSKPSHE